MVRDNSGHWSIFIDFLSIFHSWGHVSVSALYSPTGHFGRDGSFLGSFSVILVHTLVYPCDNSEMCVHAWSLVTRLLFQTDFLKSDDTCYPSY